MTKRRVNAANERRLEEDRVLFERYLDARDPVDRELLVVRCLPLARSLAGRYQRGGEPFDDVVQVASLGLVKAIDGFDATRGRAFPPTRCRPSSARSSAITATGDHVGISQMQVSRILRRCLGRLQAFAGATDSRELTLH